MRRQPRLTGVARAKFGETYRPTLVDPYRDHLKRRSVEDPAVCVQRLSTEIKARGYQGSLNLLYRYIPQGRVEGDRPSISPRSLARLVLIRTDHLSDKQRRLRDELVAACPEMIDLAGLVHSLADLSAGSR